jgi:hypothetical protein
VAEQGISYGVPAFKVRGKTFAAFKNHLSYLPRSEQEPSMRRYAEMCAHIGLAHDRHGLPYRWLHARAVTSSPVTFFNRVPNAWLRAEVVQEPRPGST